MNTKLMREALQACLPLLSTYDGKPWLEARALVEKALEESKNLETEVVEAIRESKSLIKKTRGE